MRVYDELLLKRAGTFTLSSFFSVHLSRLFNTREELDQLNEFFKKNSRNLGTIASLRKQTVESIQANIRWMDWNYVSVSKWLTENMK